MITISSYYKHALLSLLFITTVNLKAMNKEESQDGHWGPIHTAAIATDAVALQQLLENKANPNVREDRGFSPLALLTLHHYFLPHNSEIDHKAFIEKAMCLLDKGAQLTQDIVQLWTEDGCEKWAREIIEYCRAHHPNQLHYKESDKNNSKN